MKEYLQAFDKVIGYDDEKRKLMPICDMMRYSDKYKKLGVVMPSGALLQGEPGYGKTLLAKCFIEACGVPCFVCRKDKTDGEFIDYMRKCFDDAVASAPAIVFLDDMDKFANEDKDHKNAEEYVAIQACIDNVKGKDVFVIATTNDLNNLPDSLLRAGRFDINLIICGLEAEDQIKLIAHFLSGKSFLESISPEEIWQMLGGGISCAELERIINDAAMKVAFEGRDTVTRDDIVLACLNQHFGGTESSKQPSEENRVAVAYHEAGHVVVSEILTPNSVSMASIKAYNASGAGVTCYFEIGKQSKNYEYRMKRVAGLLAGKAASSVVLNIVDMGAESDLGKAKDILEDLRDKCAAFGFEYQAEWDYSDATRRNAELVVIDALNKQYEMAESIIEANRPFLEAVAKALLDKETIFAADIAAIKKELHIL